MGDRGNIAIMQPYSADRVYLYSHWDGTNLPDILKAALARRARWDDPAYLARIIFDEMTKDESGQTTGYGISTNIQDNEHPVLVVDTQNQQVLTEDESGSVITTHTFEAFIR